jgi:glutaredoxin-related protein
MSRSEENKSDKDEEAKDNKKLVSFILVLIVIGLLSFSGAMYLEESSESEENSIERSNYINASENTTVVIFYTDCPECDRTQEYVENNASNYDSVEVKSYNVSKFGDNIENRTLYKKSIDRYGIGVPAVQVNDRTWFGYTEQVENEVKNEIKYCSVQSDGCGIPDTHTVER